MLRLLKTYNVLGEAVHTWLFGFPAGELHSITIKLSKFLVSELINRSIGVGRLSYALHIIRCHIVLFLGTELIELSILIFYYC